MIPAARYQAAIEVLDQVLAGQASEAALTRWARGARYAGSKDRAAVRDHVFDAVRRMRSCAALGGAQTGRGLILGALRADGIDPDTVFSGAPYAPAPLTEAERKAGRAPRGAECRDLPDWLWEKFQTSLGDGADASAQALRRRAGVHLRVNTARISREEALSALAGQGIACGPHPLAETALTVVDGARRIRQSTAFQTGLVELQDAASQALSLALPLQPGQRVLDYCAGGGGKTLALAARMPVDVFAHDAAPERMRDLPARADRAGARVAILSAQDLTGEAPFDVVLCDVPCSGSGSWRRAPDGKWRLTAEKLAGLVAQQAEILGAAANLVRPGGILGYATCSVLEDENAGQVAGFLEVSSKFRQVATHSWPLSEGSDGFFLSLLTRSLDQ
ncbi:MAG: RsmB/NOP family class I SAM-dependent RNA methyltransferase [Marinibacterium sp.]